MLTEQKQRVQQLLRRAYILRELPTFLTGVSIALDTPLAEDAALPIEVSEPMQQQLTVRITEGLQRPEGEDHMLLERSRRASFDAEFQRLVRQFHEQTVVLSLGRFSELPLLHVRASSLERHFDDLWQLGDTVVIASPELDRGLLADSYPDDAEHGFEIVSWGLEPSWK